MGAESAELASPPTGAVFLSYASQDAEAAQKICEALRTAGIEVWFDKSELRGGDAWDRQIREQIHNCRLFIPVISANSERRDEGYFRREWSLAADRTRDMAHKRAFLLPVVIDGTPERGASVPEKFHELQWTRLPGGDTPPAFVDRIKRLLSPDAPPAAADAATIGPIPVPSVGGSPLSKALGLGAGAIAAIALAYFIADKFWLSKHAAPSSTQTATVADDHASPDIPEKSIAVLPFADMSEKKDQEYFSDGLTEELTDLLARTPELHVAARTSAFYFKGKPSTIAEIAKTLGVGNVLEGSVRKSGDTLRITVQLVQASNGYHLWSETYDRKVGDVFKTQDEIAGSVANALKVELLAGPLPGRTDNFEAYNLVLQGRFFGWQGEDQKALDCYERAVELDPNYALAWAYLSYEQSNPDWHSVDPRARQSAQRAITLDPILPDGHIALGQFDFYHASQWKDAEKELQRALTLDPKNGWAWILKGELAFERGRTDEAIESAQKAVRLEPFSSGPITDLGKVLRETNRLTEAESMDRRVLALAPKYEWAHWELAMTLLQEGKPQQAVIELERLPEASPWRLGGLAVAYFAAGRKSDSDAALAELTMNHPQDAADHIAAAHAYRNEKDDAFKWIEIAYTQHELIWGLKVSQLWNHLRSDPRYQEWLRKLDLGDEP